MSAYNEYMFGNNAKSCQIKSNTQKQIRVNYLKPYNLSKSIGKCQSCKLIQSVPLNFTVFDTRKISALKFRNNSSTKISTNKSKSLTKNSSALFKKSSNNISK